MPKKFNQRLRKERIPLSRFLSDVEPPSGATDAANDYNIILWLHNGELALVNYYKKYENERLIFYPAAGNPSYPQDEVESWAIVPSARILQERHIKRTLRTRK